MAEEQTAEERTAEERTAEERTAEERTAEERADSTPDRARKSGVLAFFAACLSPLVALLSGRNLRTDRFGTYAAILGVAIGTATVQTVLILDESTAAAEARSPIQNPNLPLSDETVRFVAYRADGTPAQVESAREETHEDYEVMRSAIRLGSLSSFAIGALIVFFTLSVVVDRRRREVGLLMSLGATRGQIAAVFTRQAVLIAIGGTLLGFAIAIPFSLACAKLGITTTGRSRISARTFRVPWSMLAMVGGLGGLVSLLGLIRPVRNVLRRAAALQHGPRPTRRISPRLRGLALVTLPLMALIFLLMRPFFREALPSLTFFVLEAAVVALGFIASLVLIPDVVQRLGQALLRLVPRRLNGPVVLLGRQRLAHDGHELAWSVGGIMLVFALLLSLHIAVRALQNEVVHWASGTIDGTAFLYSTRPQPNAARAAAHLPQDGVYVAMSGLTPWPNAVRTVDAAQVRNWAKTRGDGELLAIAERFGPDAVILSSMLARRLDIGAGGSLEISSSAGTARLTVAGVNDSLGYMPFNGPYRNSKTYALIDVSRAALIAPFADPHGTVVAVLPPGGDAAKLPQIESAYDRLRDETRWANNTRYVSGAGFIWRRVRETQRDFIIFDVILLVTSGLAALGIANQLLLSVASRRRELSLLRVLGMTPEQVGHLILLEGAFAGVLGGALAVLLGIPLGYATLGALRSVSAFEVSFEMPWYYALLTVLGAAALSSVAAWLPARRARHTHVAEAVHYE